MSQGATPTKRMLMLKIRSLPLLLLFSVVIIHGCGSNGPAGPDPFEERAIPSHMLPHVEEIVNAGNLFAFDLYAELKDEVGNTFFSPYSISSALSMTYAGAAGITAEEMARVLHVPNDPSQWHPSVGALQNSLNVGSNGYELSVANRLWAQEGYPFLESFFAIMQDCYDAGVVLINFALDPEAARLTINEWVADQTHDKIQDLIAEGLIDASTRLVLVNAIYFKGTWLTQFDPEHTTDGSFRITADEFVTVPMMMLEEAEFNYTHTDEVSILEMPYDGEDLSMIILLPDEIDGLPELEAALTLPDVESWLASMHETILNVNLPKFEMTSEFRLDEVLAGLGMPSAFGENADFSNMTGARGLYISAVIHEAFVNVNEEGTEAAAATAVIIRESATCTSFVADHPFIFLIRDNVTGSILFMGRVTDPSA